MPSPAPSTNRSAADRRPPIVAEALVRELAHLDVDVVFLNPGTDTAPVQEAVAKLHATGVAVPRIVLCPHEAVALAAAHAYFAVTGRPQVVMVHVDVGTQNLGAMVHNASRSGAGVVIIAGRTPITSYGELPGGRDHAVHWQQDVPDQAGVVRSYVKWVADLERPETVARQLSRAFQVASATPSGPVYLTATRELLMAPAPSDPHRPDPHRHRPPAPMAPDPGAARTAAGRLASARRPVITTTRLGRNPGAVDALVRLADLLGAEVIDRRERVNFPSTHPAYVATAAGARAALEDTDVLLVADSGLPWVPLLSSPPDDAFVITVDVDPVRAAIPGWSFPSDVTLQAEPGSALRALIAELEALEQREPSPLWEQRRGRHREGAPTAQSAAGGQDSGMPLWPERAAQAIDSVLRDDDVVIEEATTNADALRAALRRTVPGTYFHPGGAGLGWALGAAIGARLAAPDRRVVAIVGDGSFLFSNPTAALWTARAAGAPFLTVVLQNGGYAASRRPVFDLFPDGYSAQAGDVVGTRFDDPPDFAALARACGAAGELVTDESEVVPALRQGLAALDEGRCAVVTIPVRSAWFDGRPPTWQS